MLFFAPEIILLSLWLGWGLDRYFGELPHCHPLVGFGRLASWLEKCQNPNIIAKEKDRLKKSKRILGLWSWCLLVLPLPLVLVAMITDFGDGSLSNLSLWSFLLWVVLNAIALYFALGANSLIQHLYWIYKPLQQGDLIEARNKVGWIVSRDTGDMDRMRVVRASIESGLENGSDAIYAPLFWFAVAGAPGVLLYRFANTLDAMWGYKTAQYLHFGWAAAKLDDILNYIPARIAAFIYCLCGRWYTGLRCWQRQGGTWESPNAGPVMAAGAGALEVRLGGGDTYHGAWKERPILGLGEAPDLMDLLATIKLLKKSLWMWLLLLSGVVVLYRVIYL